MRNYEWTRRYTEGREPLYETVYHQLHYAIISGQLEPGSHLAEHALSGWLQVSRTPVRMALARLEQEGLLERRHGRAVVRDCMDRELREILETRTALEELAAVSASGKAEEKDLAVLEEINGEFARAMRAGNAAESACADERFHEELYRIADNRVLLRMIHELEGQLYGYRVRACKTEEVVERQIREHEWIIRGIRKRRPELAREAVKAHITGLGYGRGEEKDLRCG